MDDDHCVIRAGEQAPYAIEGGAEAALARLAALRAAEPLRFEGATVVPYADWVAGRRRAYLDEPAREVTEGDFDEALDVMPPIMVGPGLSSFMVREELFDGVHVQFARFGRRFLRRNVLRWDRSTWLTVDDLPAAPLAAAA